MSTVDFHILNHRVDNNINLFRAQASLTLARITPRVIHNPGTILEGRRVGYFETDAAFVSFVDDDDYSKMNLAHLTNMVRQSLTDAKPVYSNSEQSSRFGSSLLTGKHIKQWSLLAQNRRQTIPHQTIIYEKSVAQDVYKKAEDLIKKNDWHPNSIDYLMRHLVSREIGWTYYPYVTYVWNPDQKNGQHVLLREQHLKIQKYLDTKR